MLYLLDANILIDANRDYYPITRVPEYWNWLIYVAEQHQVKVPQEIYEEIIQGSDDLKHWIKKHKQQVLLDEIVKPSLVRQVIANGYGNDLNDEEVDKIGNDSFLIAHALVNKNNRCIVTSEFSKPRRVRANRHIPDVCRDLRVRCCGPFEFIRELDFHTRWNN